MAGLFLLESLDVTLEAIFFNIRILQANIIYHVFCQDDKGFAICSLGLCLTSNHPGVGDCFQRPVCIFHRNHSGFHPSQNLPQPLRTVLAAHVFIDLRVQPLCLHHLAANVVVHGGSGELNLPPHIRAGDCFIGQCTLVPNMMGFVE